MDAPPPFARLFPEAALPGHNEDNGALLELIVRALPADKVQTAAVAFQALATTNIAPEDCSQPLTKYREALDAGHLPALRWYWRQDPACLHTEFSTCHPYTVSTILASGGHLAALKAARVLGCLWDEFTCTLAAEAGHLRVLQWLRSQDPPCPWSENTFVSAVTGGHLVALQWMRAQDPPCPWGDWACTVAASCSDLEVLQWLRAQVPPCPWDGAKVAQAARLSRCSVITQWLRANDCPEHMPAYH